MKLKVKVFTPYKNDETEEQLGEEYEANGGFDIDERGYLKLINEYQLVIGMYAPHAWTHFKVTEFDLEGLDASELFAQAE